MNHHDSSVVVSLDREPQGLAETPHRDGKTYVHTRDGVRLAAQHQRVFDLMKDGRWRGLTAIAAVTGDSDASVSARLRDFRKPKFGAYLVERRYVDNGLFEYRLLVTRQLEIFQ